MTTSSTGLSMSHQGRRAAAKAAGWVGRENAESFKVLCLFYFRQARPQCFATNWSRMLTHSKLRNTRLTASCVQRCLRNDESRSSARRWDMDTSHSPTSEEWIEQRMEGFFGGSKMMVETCWDTSHQSINDKVTVYTWHIFCMHVFMYVCYYEWMREITIAWYHWESTEHLDFHRMVGWMDGRTWNKT